MYSLRSKEKQVIKMKLNNYNNVYSFRPIYKFYKHNIFNWILYILK